jgi:hypothetical protein
MVIAAVGILAAFAVSPRRGASLTICAAVVISSFLALEKVTDRLIPRQERPGWRTLGPLLLVTALSFAVLGVVLWRWKGFDPVAGALGLSVVVLAIIPELWSRR